MCESSSVLSSSNNSRCHLFFLHLGHYATSSLLSLFFVVGTLKLRITLVPKETKGGFQLEIFEVGLIDQPRLFHLDILN